AAVLHDLHERVDRLLAEVVGAAPGEGVGLVDEEDAADGGLGGLHDLGGGLADVAGDEARSVGLDELTPFDDAEAAVDLGEESGDGGLAGARVAGEDEVA